MIPLKNPTGERLTALSKAIGAWAALNFDVHAPDLGLVEEIGEATHCILKRIQGIRGFDKIEHFKTELTDAIADAAVYTLHFGCLNSYEFLDAGVDLEGAQPRTLDDVRDVIGPLMHQAADLLIGMGDLDEVIQSLVLLAAMHDIDFVDALETTWAKVSQRNWRANPADAHKQALTSGESPAA